VFLKTFFFKGGPLLKYYLLIRKNRDYWIAKTRGIRYIKAKVLMH